jgi:hypothetical protein
MTQTMEKKPLTIVVMIRTDPRLSRRPVEAIRMALGLGAGLNRVDIILIGNAPLLLTEDEEIQDYDILEKYISSFEDMETPFLIEDDFLKKHSGFKTEYLYKAVSQKEIGETMAAGDRFLIF